MTNAVDAGPIDRLTATAAEVLVHASALLVDAGFTLPSRVYLAPGRVSTAPGCEALAVVVSRAYLGFAGTEQRQVPGCFQPTSAAMQVVLHRCVPVLQGSGEPAEAAVLDEAARSLIDQGWTLMRGFQAILNDRPGPGRMVGIAGALDAVRPEGGVGGWVLNVNVQV